MQTLDVRWEQRFHNYKKALQKLREAVELSETRKLTTLELDGIFYRRERLKRSRRSLLNPILEKPIPPTFPLKPLPVTKGEKLAEFGLFPTEILALQSILAMYPNVEKALVFGSRAMDTYREGSDVDIALFGAEVTFKDVMMIRVEFSELELLLFFDVIHYEKLQSPELAAHIDRVGKIIYAKSCTI